MDVAERLVRTPLCRPAGIRAVVRILQVTKKLPPVVGGDATAVSSLVRSQTRRGHDVHVLVYRAAGIESTDHVHPVGPTQTPEGLDRIGIRRLRGMRAMRIWTAENLPSLHPDVIHAHAVDVGSAVVGAAKEREVPVVLTCHGVWYPHQPSWSLSGRIERSLLRRGYEAITSVDRASVQALREAGRPDAILVPNGVDAADFTASAQRDDALRFLFVGRHVHQKGIDDLLEATARARSEIGNRFVLELAGDGPARSRLERKARDLGLSDAVRFLGSLSRPELLSAYGRATVFVLPSRFEGFPLTILEAWAAGLPVIATSVGGIPDLCDDGNALLVPPADPEALAAAMISLSRDPARREMMGTAGRSLVRERYNWDTIAEAYERVYLNCRDRVQNGRR